MKEWVKVYCLSFGLCSDKEYLIYTILKKNFNIFNFILSEINVIDEIHENTVLVAVFYFPIKIALLCIVWELKKSIGVKMSQQTLLIFQFSMGENWDTNFLDFKHYKAIIYYLFMKE